MTRKDSEKEAERPHYYSQFWLDVAAGRKVIGGGLKTDEADSELETAEPELEPEPVHRDGRNASSVASTHEEPSYAAPMTQAEPELEPEPEFAEEEFTEQEPEFALDEEEFDQDQELPNILVDEEEIPDMELVDEDEEEFFDEEEEEEDEEEWGRGRKKPKPGRQSKLPSKPPAKKQRRDRRY